MTDEAGSKPIDEPGEPAATPDEPQLNIAENGLFEGMEAPQAPEPLGAAEELKPAESADPVPNDPPPTHFIGELDEATVLEALQLAQQIPDIRTNVERSVMGRLGPIAKELKDLRTGGLREFEFNAETSPGLKKLQELDSGIGGAMAEVLAELKVNSLNVDAAIQPLLDERIPAAQAEMHDRFQDDMLLQFVPDAFDLGPTPEFAAFMRTQPLDAQDVLQGWGQEGAPAGQKNARVAIGAFLEFKAAQKAAVDAAATAAQKKQERDKNLQRSVEDGQGGNGGAGAASVLSEQDALDARMKEQGLPFYLDA